MASASFSVFVVAPHAGAWIETMIFIVFLAYQPVAPHAGAWIETCFVYIEWPKIIVAPHAGAWIETKPGSGSPVSRMSRPTRARGLKLLHAGIHHEGRGSRPTRARGLKPAICVIA